MRIALFPGTFDPVTNGHLSVIQRGLRVFDRIVVAVAETTPKKALFSLEDRIDMMRHSVQNLPNVEVIPFNGLVVDCAVRQNASTILRGMRALADFEKEFQQALMNRRINHAVETVFFMADYQWLFTSSTIVKTAVQNGASSCGLTSAYVQRCIEKAYGLPPAPVMQSEENADGQDCTPVLGNGLAQGTAIYPGTFDPITKGHLSIIRRALSLFDKVIVAVAENPGKNPLYSLEERVAFVRQAVQSQADRIDVISYDNLTVDAAQKVKACAIIRGLRAVGDFEYEFQMALMNRRLNKSVETVFFMTDYKWLYVSSSIIKACASHGASVEGLVPHVVQKSLISLYQKGTMAAATPCLEAPAQGYLKHDTAEEGQRKGQRQ